MRQFLLISLTFLVISILIFRHRTLDFGILKTIRHLILEINRMYRLLFLERSLLTRFVQGGLIIFAQVSTFVSLATGIFRHLRVDASILHFEPLIKGGIVLFAFLLVHYAIGYVLLLSNKIHLFFYRVENQNLKMDFILSYTMISTFLLVLLLFPDQFAKNISISLIGMGICYFLNLKTLMTMMINPTYVKSVQQQQTSFSRIMIAAILILIMLILNLYLMVCLVCHLPHEVPVFSNANNYFDLFYYTIITFTTIGYGDITPTTMAAKTISLLISVTSVICLSIFLSTILSYRDQINDNEGNS
ncbi:potassium channel family protein [Turicibacter sanguinis]|uniref:potassium channel family protein n=1 Tax=Turicibacter sanguinis TaxID=154288 RepID=UPI0021D4CB94|nr:potassium channel family protein [Turicibacter sanguinis]MCU7197800.1 potassium channel family protein [Turicibacter sanguinis]